MKKHLFYTFLGIFISTAAVTLFGITNVIAIQDKYLTPLFGALLIELIGAVIALYRRADFFSNDSDSVESIAIKQPKTIVDETVGADKPLTANNILINHKKSNDLKQMDQDAVSLDEYFDSLNKLTDRFREKEKLREEMQGRRVIFIGKVDNVTSRRETTHISLYSLREGVHQAVFADLPDSHKLDAFSLQKGDVIEVIGQVDTTSRSFTTIKADNFRRKISEPI